MSDHQESSYEFAPAGRIRVLLVDDDLLVVEALQALLAAEPQFKIVGTASDGREAVQTAQTLRPDVVLMDIRMPGMNGIEATRQILEQQTGLGPQTVPRILFLSASGEKRFVGAALRAGASGYLLKSSGQEELKRALRAVARGEIYLSPTIGQTVIESLRELAEADTHVDGPLSPREREVLQLVAEGWSTKAIAERLKLTSRTIGTHREHIMEKLGIRSIAELTKYALRAGLTSLE